MQYAGVFGEKFQVLDETRNMIEQRNQELSLQVEMVIDRLEKLQTKVQENGKTLKVSILLYFSEF